LRSVNQSSYKSFMKQFTAEYTPICEWIIKALRTVRSTIWKNSLFFFCPFPSLPGNIEVSCCCCDFQWIMVLTHVPRRPHNESMPGLAQIGEKLHIPFPSLQEAELVPPYTLHRRSPFFNVSFFGPRFAGTAFLLCRTVSQLFSFLLYRSESRSQRPRGKRHELSSPAQKLGSWVRISIEACMSVCV
jgi:hypothetical protein